MRTRIAGGLSVSHLRSETDLKSHKKSSEENSDDGISSLLFVMTITVDASEKFLDMNQKTP